MDSFLEIIGQLAAVTRLKALADAILPEHILLIGPEGIGKETLARAFASKLGTQCRAADGAELRLKGDLTAILTNLDDCDLLYIDNIDQVPRPLMSQLRLVVQDYKLDMTIGQGPSSRSHRLDLREFRFMGGTSRKSGNELAKLFLVQLHLAAYTTSELENIAKSIGSKQGILVNDAVAKLLVRAAKGTPGGIEPLIRRVSRLLSGNVSEADVQTALGGLLTDWQNSENGVPTDINRLSGLQFEQLIMSLLIRMGFHAEMTEVSGDGGIDIVAILDRPIVGGRYLFQCKRFSGAPVGASTVRDFYGALRADRTACKGIIITTSVFTRDAHEFADGVGVELIEGVQLQGLLQICSADPTALSDP